jgi:amidase
MTVLRSARETVAAIAAGETSARAEVDAAIARIEAADGAINAVVVRDFDRARSAADVADARVAAGERLPLLGLPMTVKEAFDLTGLPTTWGLEAGRSTIASSDAVAVRRLRAAGAIILGKTNIAPGLADWQSDNPIYGNTANPHDPARTAGGSSGGSAAALAAGMVALELGSDIGGSIRVPSHFCGVWGHKPTYGALDEYGHRAPGSDGAAPALGVIGPMARNGGDLALALDILADHPLPKGEVTPSALRILLLPDHPATPTEAAIGDAVQQAGDALARLGATVETASDRLPDLMRQHRAYQKMLAITLSAGAPSPAGKVATAADWFDLRDEQARNARAWARLFAEFDAVIAPPNAVTAFAHRTDDFNDRSLTIDGTQVPFDVQLVWAGLATFPGLPATCVPVSRDAAGLPVGVQVMTNRFQDHRAIAIAQLLHGAL